MCSAVIRVANGGVLSTPTGGRKMPDFKWSKRSLAELKGIHPDLRALCDEALRLSKQDFMIVDGLRTLAQQREYVRRKASKTLKSRHLQGFAVDVAALINGKVRWEDPLYAPIREAFVKASQKLDIPMGPVISWDIGHIELDKRRYPDK